MAKLTQIAVSDVAFHQQLARLLDVAPTSDGFWSALASFLRRAAGFDTWVAVAFRPDGGPLVLDDHAANQGDSGLFAAYRDELYVLDPFYQFCLRPIQPGLYRLDEVAPSCFRETEYFRRYFSLNVVEDEVQFLVPTSAGRVLSLSLGSSEGYSDAQIGALHLYAPWVLSLIRQASGKARSALEAPAGVDSGADSTANTRAGLAQRLLARGVSLTERELEVATLILAGHPTKGIARALSISPETAKAHRRNLYAKLAIGSQAELFLMLYGAGDRVQER